MMRALPYLAFATFLCAVLPSRPARAGHAIEAGVGWQNTGASRETRWWPAIQGSRKDVSLYLGWRLVGARRVYYAPLARLNYTNFWSIAGGGNLLGATLGPAGIGVYLSRPPSRLDPAGRRGRWFATLDLNLASLQLGGNVTPGSPADERIPDPDAYRATLQAEIQRSGALSSESSITQRYPFGSYSYVSLGFPVHLRVWNQASQRTGVGFFFELNPLLLEWALSGQVTGGPAYGFNFTGGATVTLF